MFTSLDESRLIEYLSILEKSAEEDRLGDFYVALSVDVKLKRSAGALASQVQLTQDPNAMKVVLQEEDVREAFPWDYNELVKRCRARYAGFLQNKPFHAICAEAKQNTSLVRVRFL